MITTLFHKMRDLVSKAGWLYITERERERKPGEKVFELSTFRYTLDCRH